MLTVTTEARRVYVAAPYGHPCVAKLKELGARWDPDSKRWWLGSAKRTAVEAIVAETAEAPAAEDPDTIKVLGKAVYKDRTYYVRWAGRTRSGALKARLCSMDGKVDFWAALTRGENSAEAAVIVQEYKQPKTIGGLRRYVERRRNEQARDDCPGEDCYWSGSAWLVRGCATCRAEGQMCERCRHDL